MQLTHTSFGRGRGFSNESSGATECHRTRPSSRPMPSLLPFRSLVASADIPAHKQLRWKLNSYNESLKLLSDYASTFFTLSEGSVSFIPLANTTGATTGIEFNSARGKVSLLVKANIIHVFIFALPDVSGSTPGIVVPTHSETHLKADGISFACCRGPTL